MRKSRILIAALPLMALALSPARAQTPPAATGGGDRLAVGWLSERFLADVAARIDTERTERERLSGGYLQEETGLIWRRVDNLTDLNWYDAEEYCTDLEVADWSDWRMPTIEELEKLHDRRSVAKYKLPAAIRLTGCCPWSSTRNGDGSAWNFSFRYRKRFSGSLNYSYELRALCVRRASEEDLLFFERIFAEREAEES